MRRTEPERVGEPGSIQGTIAASTSYGMDQLQVDVVRQNFNLIKCGQAECQRVASGRDNGKQAFNHYELPYAAPL